MSGMKALPNRYMTAPVQPSPEEKLREVSEMYEKHFLREMTKAMRATVSEGGFIKQNQAERIFREQLDDKYVEEWGKQGGIGLSNLIYDQLIEKFGVRMGIKAPVAKPQGPLPLDAKSDYTAHQYTRAGKSEAMAVRFERMGEGLSPDSRRVKTPWDGILLGKRSLGDEQTLVEIGHDNGLKSQMVFKGGLSKVSTGQTLQAGDTLGFLSPEARALYWTVEAPGPQTVSE